MPKLGGTAGAAYATPRPTHVESTATAAESHRRDKGIAREPVGRSRRRGDEAEQQEGPHRLGGGSGGHPDEAEEHDAERARWDPTGSRHRVVDAGKEERAAYRDHHEDDTEADRRVRNRLAPRQAEDRPEEHVHARGGVGPHRRGRVEGEEEGTETQDPGEDAPDDRVVGTTPGVEQGHHDGNGDAEPIEADEEAHPRRRALRALR